ncbi:MAG TPA: class I SAM-dependent methyltransferase [Tianweitania sediminis]|jgi:16S rRNA (guanine1207-N2)-methyltransferase|nr:class I SAM-dependent methyltransferase [Tianweitania sediminis]
MQADQTWRTLFHPFEVGDLPVPGPSERVLFLGARPGFRLPDGFGAELTCVQGFRPDFLMLKRQGRAVVPEPDGDNYDVVLVQGSKHRGQNEGWIAEALMRAKAGGLIVVAASKKDGADSLRKRMTNQLAVQNHAAKHHGTVFWLQAGRQTMPLPEPVLVDNRFQTRPGMFSHGHADAGSQFLAEHLPADLKGDVADFCAGWGYLAAALETRDPIRSIDLYEADHAALEAAKEALAGSRRPFSFFWHDLASETVTRRYDAIVMNPPFHASSQKAEPDLGATMIRAAALALKGHGRLVLVANRALPYERALAGVFAASGETARNDTFKVLWGAGPRTR